MKLENTAFTRTKSKAERKKEKIKDINKAEDVWKQQSGTDDEIALLYVALARAAGLKAWPMKVVDRSRAMFDPSYLSAYQLDDYIAIVELGGKNIYLDPGQKMCPFGYLSWKHTWAQASGSLRRARSSQRLPPITYKESTMTRDRKSRNRRGGQRKGNRPLRDDRPRRALLAATDARERRGRSEESNSMSRCTLIFPKACRRTLITSSALTIQRQPHRHRQGQRQHRLGNRQAFLPARPVF